MFESETRAQLLRTGAFAAVAGIVAMLAFAVLPDLGVEGILRTILSVAVGLTVGISLENVVFAPD